MLTVFVKTPKNEPEPFELDETSTCEELIACVATKYNVDPENITICVDRRVINKDVIISKLDLGNILYFDAIFATDRDEFIEDMFDIEQQKKIEEQIRKEQIDHNLKYAYDNTPEAFTQFSLLWIKCEINGTPVVALVDTGAQMSIIPLDVAKNCSVEYLIDTRYRIITQGVGTQKSMGRIHALNVKIGNEVWTNSFTVLTGSIDHVILGIDWMTKNRAIIDLSQRCIILNGKKIPFIERQSGT